MLDYEQIVRDGLLFFIEGGGGGYHFWDLQTIFFLKNNAFQTIFFIKLCNENNFFTTILKNITGFSYFLFEINTLYACIHMKNLI